MKVVGLALALASFACVAATSSGIAVPPIVPPQRAAVTQADWQWPQLLPRRFRNHCAIDAISGRPYCSDHCGFDYQFYLCSPASFGCCRIGYGYCDWSGLLRCHP
jgi:hypothetical protein